MALDMRNDARLTDMHHGVKHASRSHVRMQELGIAEISPMTPAEGFIERFGEKAKAYVKVQTVDQCSY